MQMHSFFLVVCFLTGYSLALATEANEPVQLNRPVFCHKLSLLACLTDTSRNPDPSIRLNRELLIPLYVARQSRPLWTHEQGLNTIGHAWLIILRKAGVHGLDPETYSLSEIENSLHTSPDNLLTLELLLSDAFLRFSENMYSGQASVPQRPDVNYVRKAIFSPLLGLINITSLADFEHLLDVFIPENAAYRGLQKELAVFQQRQQRGEWKMLDAGPSLKQGVRHYQVINLRNLLRLLGDFSAEMQADPYYFSQALERAVKSFQHRHHLVVDGVVGFTTRQEMSVSPARRIEQIRLSLERLRQLPANLGDHYLWVNLAASTLTLFEENKEALTMRVVIGRPQRSTPTITSVLKTIVVNPEWVVPRRLAVEDLLPMQQLDPEFLGSKQIRVLSGWAGVQTEVATNTIDWSKLSSDYFPYQLRQSAGKTNSLGRFKFLFDNPFEIYLHDTPVKRLFQLERRAFSSGCIRLEKPTLLAKRLLQQEASLSSMQILSFLQSDRTKSLRLKNTIPIYIVYLTAWVTNNEMHFQRDFYHRDVAALH
ncbi:MAG: L,D-transpeptidase family protein [Gammaproteobacteria bacterium]